MTFDDWKASARLVIAGPDMPQHALDCEVQVAWVFADDSFISVIRDPARPFGTCLHVMAGNWDEMFDEREFSRAAEYLWDNHASFEQPQYLKEAMEQACRTDDLDVALRSVMAFLAPDLDGGVAGIMFTGEWEQEWPTADADRRREMLQTYLAREVAYL